MNASLMATLKRGTVHLHREIEAGVPLLNPTLTIVEYGHYLKRLLGFYDPLEESLQSFIPQVDSQLQLSERLKSQWLISDLKSLSLDISSFSGQRAMVRWPRSLAHLMGVLYVVEGATLGGEIIYRSLQTNLGLPENQLRFFKGYGPDTGAMWVRFRKVAEAIVPPSQYDEALTAAQDMFQSLKQWVSTQGF